MPTVSVTWLLEVPQPALPAAPPSIPSRENFTSEEIAEAVNKLVQGAIRRPYGILGERKTLDAFDDTMDAAAGVFILHQASPFYVLLLGARRLADITTVVLAGALDLLDAVEATGRRVKPLTNLTSLGNARAALFALENASAQRSSAFEDIEEAPAFQRFDRHTDRFLADAGASILDGESVAQTPQQARKKLGTLVTTLTAGYQDVLRRVRLLENGVEDYNSMNLPALLAKGVIGRARGVIEDRIEQLEPLTPTGRLEVLRETALDVLAGKAVVKGFGSLAQSGEFVPIEGRGLTYTDAEHPGTPAVLESLKLDPYIILPGADTLDFVIDGNPTTTTSIPLQHSFLARLDSSVREPWEIVNNVNDELRVLLEPGNNLLVDLTPGAARTAPQIVADINAEITSQPIVAETFLAPEKFIGQVNITGTDPNMIFTSLTAVNFVSTLDVNVGDAVLILDGAMAQTYFLITARTTTTITATRSGGTAATPATGVTISVGLPGRFVRIRVKDGEEAEALADSLLLKANELEGDHTAWRTLGVFPQTESRCRRTRAEEVANSINSSASAALQGVARLLASTTFVGGAELSGRSEPSNPSLVVSSIFRVRNGSITNVGPTPARFGVAGALTAGVAVGDILTLRTAPTTSQVGLRGTITVVTDTEVRANMNGTVSLGTGLDIEFGLDLDLLKDQVVRILAPSPASGDYRVLDGSSNPTEIALDRPLAIWYGPAFQPLAFLMQAGALRVDFASTDTTTSSQLRIEGTAGELFFDSVPVENVGSTPYVLLEKDPRVLEVGDRLELYSGQYEEPEYEFELVGFEQGQKLLETDVPIPNSFIELDFTVAIDTPFARIRKVQRNNYDDFKVQLGLWVDLAVNGGRFFSDLNRFINPLLVNDNPTISAVNTAKVHVQTLVDALGQLQLVLADYQVDVVPQVDTLVDSFLARGADRAVDTLLEGRFTEFFGYNSEEVSYLGNALERLRDVSRLDLPVRKTKRKEVIDQELSMGEFEEPDFEFDQSDIRDNDEPDLPGQFVEVPGST